MRFLIWSLVLFALAVIVFGPALIGCRPPDGDYPPLNETPAETSIPSPTMGATPAGEECLADEFDDPDTVPDCCPVVEPIPLEQLLAPWGGV